MLVLVLRRAADRPVPRRVEVDDRDRDAADLDLVADDRARDPLPRVDPPREVPVRLAMSHTVAEPPRASHQAQ
ncbi:hypothetical protein [Gandjariella thermophila]|uniref:hypothetical protein n=1 Tax=Gandjariella thermophila TaxID=1931992 RepID=UPI001CEF7E6F|nr:hypothetical protein [Gandjariella thermophila]